MSEKPRMKNCPACDAEMMAIRNVCPDCGHMTTMFKVKLGVGCFAMTLCVLSFIALMVMAYLGPPGQ